MFIFRVPVFCLFLTFNSINSSPQFGSDHLSKIEIGLTFYKSGEKRSELKMSNNNSLQYTEWQKDGLKKITGSMIRVDGYTYRDGLWKRWYDNGNLRSLVNYKYDKLVGRCTYYHKNGLIQMEKDYGMADKVQPFYNTEGYHIGNINPANHYPEKGLWIYRGHFVTIETNYVDWMKNGFHREWTSGNSKLLVEGNYKNGKKHGNWTRYHQSSIDYDNSTGIKLYTQEYVNDKKNGKYVHYYPNGRKKEEGYFNGVQKVGLWSYYLNDGTVSKKVDCNRTDCK